MKINLEKDVDLESFMMHEHVVNGDVLTLIQPKHIGAKWNKNNLHFRSSVWNHEDELISASFPKFFNWGEQPDLSPVPSTLKNCTVVEKLDGSTLIVSKYKGNFIFRTRGTVDAINAMANGHELEIFKTKILPVLSNFYFIDSNETWKVSYLFEWVSPQNKIVINYGDEPDWTLVGIVHHKDYYLYTQIELDNLAWQHGLKRPAKYTFTDVADLLANVDAWKGKEGVVVYSHDDQNLHKVKGAWYLKLHFLKSELSNIEKVLDVWLNQGCPDYTTFYNYIFNTFDYELAEQVRGKISTICDAYKEVNLIINGMKSFVENKLKNLPSRKEQAMLVLSSYGNTNRASFLFKLLDGKQLEKDDIKKLIFQCIKK